MSLNQYLNIDNFKQQAAAYGSEPPFDHVVIDNFFLPEVAETLSAEFPDFDDPVWHQYNNAIEVKKVCNNWNVFPVDTYNTFTMLNSAEFLELLGQTVVPQMKLYADPGLNGGGWHIHRRGGKLNTHLDYSLHPKLGLQRKLNIIIYLNKDWQKEWGGSLGLWSNESSEKPGELSKSVWSKYNRAVIFDTTQNSWHGLPDPLQCPEAQYRKSMAAYFLCDPPKDVETRGKALFAPTAEQSGDDAVIELIKKRSDVKSAATVYKSD